MLRRFRIALPLFLALAAPAVAQEDAPSAGSDTNEPLVVLHLGERNVSWAEYGAWLVRAAGPRHMDEIARARAVRRALHATGSGPTVAEARAVVDEQVARRIEAAFGGDRSQWIAELRRTGTSEAEFYAQRTAEALGELRVQELVQDRRRTDQAGLREAWEALHGPDGRRPELQAIFLEIEEPRFPEGVDERGKETLREAKRRQIERKAQEVLRRARGGADFDALVQEHSMDEASKLLEGYLPEPYSMPEWPQELANELRTAEAGDLVGPVLARGGYWVFRIDSFEETPFEEVRDELLRHLLQSPPTNAETNALFTDLLDATPRLLPEIWTAPDAAVDRFDRPVGAVGQDPITRRDAALWLTGRRGFAEAPLFAQVHAVEARAEEKGVEVSELAVRQRIEANVAAKIEIEYRGNAERWEQALAETGHTPETHRLSLVPRTRQTLLAEALLISDRVVTEDEVRAQWEDRYGPGGKSPRIRLILRRPVPLPEGTRWGKERVEQYLKEQELEITTMLGELRGRIRAGEDFATLAQRHSQDALTKDRGGLQPHRFRLDTWPRPVRETLEELAVGEVSPVVEVGTDYYLFENSGVTHVPFEDVAASLREELETRRPSSSEVARYLATLAAEHPLEVLPALVEPYLAGEAPR